MVEAGHAVLSDVLKEKQHWVNSANIDRILTPGPLHRCNLATCSDGCIFVDLCISLPSPSSFHIISSIICPLLLSCYYSQFCVLKTHPSLWPLIISSSASLDFSVHPHLVHYLQTSQKTWLLQLITEQRVSPQATSRSLVYEHISQGSVNSCS